MISQEKVEALCQQIESMFIPDGPLRTEHGARSHVRRTILKWFKEAKPGEYERITYLARTFLRDCQAQAINDREQPDIRAEYATQAKAWAEFDPMIQRLWYVEAKAS